MTTRVLVVDDEPVARDGLASLVRRLPGISDVIACDSAVAAVSTIRTARPDIVLLDVQLSPGTGFEVINEVGIEDMPLVIFVTAFDQFALRAFETAAVDYVLKPVDPHRLTEAVTRAVARLRERNSAEALQRIAALGASFQQPPPRPIPFVDGDRTLLYEPNEITRIVGADDYVRIYGRGRDCLVRDTLDALEDRLTTPPFFRVHRSAIINLRHVVEIARVSRHRHAVHLRDGSSVPVSEKRRELLEQWLSTRRSRSDSR
jgi:two-component system LytT family response regulator